MGELNMSNKEGTYNHCSKCKIKRNCCCDFDTKIDNVIVSNNEKENIINRVGKDSEKFFKKINNEAYNIISHNSICPFYSKGCTIYDIRPNDCKLFPYDLKKINDKYFLIQYDLPCGSSEVHESVEHIVKELCLIIDTYTNKKLEDKLDKLQFKIIKEVKL